MVSWVHLRREPYRLLFPVGILFGCLGVSHWLFYALHWAPSSSSFFHAAIQMGTYMICFISGFLMTALPRFASAAPSSSAELAAIIGLLGVEGLALLLGWWTLAQACVIALLVVLIGFAGRRFIRRRVPVGPPTEFLWIPFGALLGIVGSMLLIAGWQAGAAPWLLGIGKPMAQQGFVLAIVTGVAGFLAPRLMGRELPLVAPIGVSPERIRWMRHRRLLLHGLAAVGLAVSFVLEGVGRARLGYLLRALIVSAELVWTTQPHRPPRPRELYVRLLWVSLWMVMLGLWGAGLWPRYRVTMLHLMFLGGFSLMTFAVGTMVILTHAGEGERLRRPMWALRMVAGGIGTATAARVLADLWPPHYFPLLATASIAWLASGVGWLVFIAPYVARPVPNGTFERVHEETKRRLRLTTAAASPR